VPAVIVVPALIKAPAVTFHTVAAILPPVEVMFPEAVIVVNDPEPPVTSAQLAELLTIEVRTYAALLAT
jgi:hypothetical protein